jgi:hypothetical protein
MPSIPGALNGFLDFRIDSTSSLVAFRLTSIEFGGKDSLENEKSSMSVRSASIVG